jgi:hypothetical protein
MASRTPRLPEYGERCEVWSGAERLARGTAYLSGPGSHWRGLLELAEGNGRDFRFRVELELRLSSGERRRCRWASSRREPAPPWVRVAGS